MTTETITISRDLLATLMCNALDPVAGNGLPTGICLEGAEIPEFIGLMRSFGYDQLADYIEPQTAGERMVFLTDDLSTPAICKEIGRKR